MDRQANRGRCSMQREKHIQGKCETVQCALEDTSTLEAELRDAGRRRGEELGGGPILKSHDGVFVLDFRQWEATA